MPEISTTGSIMDFFEEYNCTKAVFSGGELNKSVDGSGKNASIREREALGIVNYLLSVYPHNPIRVLDCGAGLGHLQTEFDLSDRIEGYSFEGYFQLAKRAKCDPRRMVVCDLTIPITDDRLKKRFHISTSFEFLEHVPRADQETVWSNLAYLSDIHLCSIHIANEEHSVHPTIRSSKEWEAFFEKKGYAHQSWQYIPEELAAFDCSIFYEVIL